jgi:phosphoserine aminotransferase
MTTLKKPTLKPKRPYFSSGPCVKRPGWTPDVLSNALLGRAHRSVDGLARINHSINLTREVLKIPDDFEIAIVSGSATGAMEMALWNFLGPRGIDILTWDVFGKRWAGDIQNQLNLSNIRLIEAEYGDLPDLSQCDFNKDVVFTWSGTSTGVRVPNGDWIAADRKGLTICDAISSVFAIDLPWDKLDVTTFSWQKVLGGEAGLGMIVFSSRAIERIENYQPPWPIPGLFRLHNNEGHFMHNLCKGETNNTPSFMLIEDYIDALNWVKSIGGIAGIQARVDQNYQVVEDYIKAGAPYEFLEIIPEYRSKTAVTLKLKNNSEDWMPIKKIAERLTHEGAGYDLLGHIMVCPNIRIWCGPTVEKEDLAALMPWLTWVEQ